MVRVLTQSLIFGPFVAVMAILWALVLNIIWAGLTLAMLFSITVLPINTFLVAIPFLEIALRVLVNGIFWLLVARAAAQVTGLSAMQQQPRFGECLFPASLMFAAWSVVSAIILIIAILAASAIEATGTDLSFAMEIAARSVTGFLVDPWALRTMNASGGLTVYVWPIVSTLLLVAWIMILMARTGEAVDPSYQRFTAHMIITRVVLALPIFVLTAWIGEHAKSIHVGDLLSSGDFLLAVLLGVIDLRIALFAGFVLVFEALLMQQRRPVVRAKSVSRDPDLRELRKRRQRIR